MITGCVKPKIEYKVEYVLPDIPESLLEPCDQLQDVITTNGELLNAYITTRTMYNKCSTKVATISSIIDLYKTYYENVE